MNLNFPPKITTQIFFFKIIFIEIFYHNNTIQDDGGSPITHYIIEQCTADSKPNQENWREIGETVAGRTTFKCSLEEKQKYRFRVRALNRIGTSLPSLLPDAVLAKDPWGKFVFAGKKSYFDICFCFRRSWTAIEC